MKLKVWGARGSVPAPGPEMNRYGGNTSCVELELSDGSTLIIDAGTGIRSLGVGIAKKLPKINILLTHLHLDHIQGLMFFAPCFRSESEITIWGPSSPEASLEERIARYISAPLSPVEVRELPCEVNFRDTPPSEWELGPAKIRAEAVTHRGPPSATGSPTARRRSPTSRTTSPGSALRSIRSSRSGSRDTTSPASRIS
jgi:phosphoribosyl 1,2-cyclic phosphodiesterase